MACAFPRVLFHLPEAVGSRHDIGRGLKQPLLTPQLENLGAVKELGLWVSTPPFLRECRPFDTLSRLVTPAEPCSVLPEAWVLAYV